VRAKIANGKGFRHGPQVRILFPGVANGLLTVGSPYKFEAPWHAFEFAFHALEAGSSLVIVSMAWLTREDGRCFTRTPQEPDMETVTYWVQRLEPLIRAEGSEEVIVVFCNRSGTEDDVHYAGTSTVVGIKDGEVSVYGILGRGVKELLIVDTDNPPIAKLVQGADMKAAVPTPLTTQTYQPQAPENQGGPTVDQGVSSQLDQDTRRMPQPPDGNGVSLPSAVPSAEKGRKGKVPPNVSIPEAHSYYRRVAVNPSDNIDESPTISTPTAPSPTPHSLRPWAVTPGLRDEKDNPPTPSPRYPFFKPDAAATPREPVYAAPVSNIVEAVTPISPSEQSPSLFYWTPYNYDLQAVNGGPSTSHPLGPTNPSAENSPAAAPASSRPRDGSVSRRISESIQQSDLVDIAVGLEALAEGAGGAKPPRDVGRPASPKSRNASRSRQRELPDRTDTDSVLNVFRSSIPIAASPSVFQQGPGGFPQRPSSRVDVRYSTGLAMSRSSSRARGWSGSQQALDPGRGDSPFAVGNRQLDNRSGTDSPYSRAEGWSATPSASWATPDRTESRAMSRGRQPGERIPPPARSGSSAAQDFRSSSRPATQDDEIMAVVEFDASGCHVSGLGSFPDDITPEELVTEVTSSPLCQTAIPFASLAGFAESTDSCPTMSGRSVQTLATPQDSPATPPLFDPKTPKAMSFADFDPDALAGSAAAPAAALRSVEMSLLMVQERIESLSVGSRPKSAVW